MDARGLFAPMMRMMPGTEPSTRAVSITTQGSALIQEGSSGTSVIDLDAGHMLMIDHGARTMMRITMQEAAGFVEGTMSQMAGSLGGGDSAAQLQQMQQEMAASGMQMTFSVREGSTGRQREFGSLQATHHWVVLRADMDQPPAGMDEGGAIFMISEVWSTDEVPTEAELFADWAMRIPSNPHMNEFRELSQDQDGMPINALMDSWMPGFSAAMVEMLDAIGRIGGTLVEETMIIAMGPAHLEVDASNLDQLAVWENPEGLENVMPGPADVLRGALGGALGGLMGGRRDPPPPPPPPASPSGDTLAPVLRLVTTRSNIAHQQSDDDVLGELMTRVAGYRVQSLADVMRTVPQ
ncbi:MAG TPA: hypothetical protein VMN39_01285 [Longimicrobiaceae bacterium]|nr:hypothetical protein [Longimicrobiaceae bacterium]